MWQGWHEVRASGANGRIRTSPRLTDLVVRYLTSSVREITGGSPAPATEGDQLSKLGWMRWKLVAAPDWAT